MKISILFPRNSCGAANRGKIPTYVTVTKIMLKTKMFCHDDRKLYVSFSYNFPNYNCLSLLSLSPLTVSQFRFLSSIRLYLSGLTFKRYLKHVSWMYYSYMLFILDVDQSQSRSSRSRVANLDQVSGSWQLLLDSPVSQRPYAVASSGSKRWEPSEWFFFLPLNWRKFLQQISLYEKHLRNSSRLMKFWDIFERARIHRP